MKVVEILSLALVLIIPNLQPHSLCFSFMEDSNSSSRNSVTYQRVRAGVPQETVIPNENQRERVPF